MNAHSRGIIIGSVTAGIMQHADQAYVSSGSILQGIGAPVRRMQRIVLALRHQMMSLRGVMYLIDEKRRYKNQHEHNVCHVAPHFYRDNYLAGG